MKNLIKYSNECDDEYFTVRVEKLSIPDVLAKECKYHRSGYRTTTRLSLRKDPNKSLERDLRETSFSELKKYMNKKILTNDEFVRIFYPSGYYGQLQEKKGVEQKSTLVQTWMPGKKQVKSIGKIIRQGLLSAPDVFVS